MIQGIDTGVIDDFLESILVKESFAKIKPLIPVKDYKKEELSVTQQKELALWHVWNDSGRKPVHLKPLLDSFKPLLQKEVNAWKSVEIPESAIKAEMRKQFVHAIKTFDPSHPKKARLSSWVKTNLIKSTRFMKTYQNLGKIPEGNISKIREFKQAKDTLFNLNGYEPDTKSLADHLKWSQKKVIQLQKELSRADLPVSGFPGEDPVEVLAPKELEAIKILQFDNRLSPEERSVYEYTFGINGKSRLQPGQIAKKTGLHPSKISRIRSKIKDYVLEAQEVL